MSQDNKQGEQTVLSYDDLVYHIGKKEIQKLEKEKISSILKSNVEELKERIANLQEVANKNKNRSNNLKESNERFSEKNKELADKVEELRGKVREKENQLPKRNEKGQFVGDD